MRVYFGDCGNCSKKKVNVVSIFRTAFIPGVKMTSPHELIEVCEECLSAILYATEDTPMNRVSDEQKKLMIQYADYDGDVTITRDELYAIISEIESLQRDKAALEEKLSNCLVLAEDLTLEKEALIEVLEWYGSEYAYQSAPIEDGYGWDQPEVIDDKGERARTILSRMKGEMQGYGA
ncbi:hypothetical protein DFQ01_121102 [Paenibacillus cellulosilyticus]|uniref:Uncharacterized protein n=1 Tax=Paenibacillus cellulosilyticus TaxID=375489 RepID=A0A2V2YRD6_9BACL|nr:hypothetical protein [Paenibacillus cellulosilyticus]PWV97458.1 hypothetical protein DFQ01_121102 [Paenibacillus cellulosilyticus]QKS48505.1 hypothetical protein HUB94_30180 [Paenibacillus cellulosilyticus]